FSHSEFMKFVFTTEQWLRAVTRPLDRHLVDLVSAVKWLLASRRTAAPMSEPIADRDESVGKLLYEPFRILSRALEELLLAGEPRTQPLSQPGGVAPGDDGQALLSKLRPDLQQHLQLLEECVGHLLSVMGLLAGAQHLARVTEEANNITEAQFD